MGKSKVLVGSLFLLVIIILSIVVPTITVLGKTVATSEATTETMKEITTSTMKESTKETTKKSTAKAIEKKATKASTKKTSDQSIVNEAKLPQGPQIPTLGKSYEPIYTNKKPDYQTDEKGTYPTFAWQPEGQTNVLNHQGGINEQTGWDKVTSWNVLENDYTHSYIKYGADATNPDVQLRKYAQQTDREEEFKIKLNVRGNTTQNAGVDIVFLLDNSDSMNNTETGEPQNRKAYANEALDKIITELKNVYASSGESIRIGGHIFSDYTQNAWGDKQGQIPTFQLSNNVADWDKLKAEYARAYSLGATFTQRGLTVAKDVFDAAPNSEGRRQLLFVLTDGAPNLSWTTKDTGTPNKDMFVDRLHFTNFNKGTKGSYNPGDVLGTKSYKTTIIPAYNGVINSHITTTNSTAMDIKNAGVEIHTIAMQLTVNVNETNKREELLRGLYKMSTKRANGNQDAETDTAEDFFYYYVEKGADLTEYFKSWYETVIRTVDKGKIVDPLGDMVTLVTEEGKAPKVTQVANGAAKIEDLPVISHTAEQINVDNINLSGDQEIEVEYTVRLKSDDPSFVSNLWYPTNKETTLQPLPERTNDLLEFGSPSVKLPKAEFRIPVMKVWQDDLQGVENYWKLRPDSITAVLQHLEGTDWKEVERVELTEANDWKAQFSPVEGGADQHYRVIEPTRTPGYKQAVLSQEQFTSEDLKAEGLTITNELLRGSYRFWKFMEDGKTPFTKDLPTFQVKTAAGRLVAENLTPDKNGAVTIEELALGEYLVEETHVPQGFQKMAPFTLHVTEDKTAETLIIKVNDQTEEYHAINALENFALRVEKMDDEGKSLAGASFKLTGEAYEKTIVGGPAFDFSDLRPGDYTLTETVSPEGYEAITEPILFTIQVDGRVTIKEHPNVAGSGGIKETGNTIALEVTNKQSRPGALPHTGGIGLRSFYLLAGVLVSMGVFLSSVYVYHSRKP
ncbi:SpaA isopeptide-forming pilin-related protein [Enterococcus gilvus]|uniref:vWA domain-containing protein n=1 Tax=Enterococcus gilvus TaxID=160453 RepID=UPI003D6A3DDB